MQVPVTETGWLPYDLAGNWCEECGRAKSFRLWPGTLTGCKTCDEIVTRHRCTGRPRIGELADGQMWECRDCGSRWTPRTETEYCLDCCGDCGHQVPVRRWNKEEGDRIGTAPRHDPQPFAPFRNILPRSAVPASPPGPFGECYPMASGAMVHVRPGCRCTH